MSQMFRLFEANSGTVQRKRGLFKKAVQQARERRWGPLRKDSGHAFLNIPRKGLEDLAKSSTSAVDSANLGQASREEQVWFDDRGGCNLHVFHSGFSLKADSG